MATTERPRDEIDRIDNPLERLELLAGDDDAVASFLDTIDTRGEREREMLTELARSRQISDIDRFADTHRRALAALETLGRHGYHSAEPPRWLGPLRPIARYAIELVARYVVVSYLRRMSGDLRNLYWLREMQAEPDSRELKLLRRARMQAENVMLVFQRREIGLPSFVIGGLLIPVFATTLRLAQGVAYGSWVAAAVTGLVGALVFAALAWVILRGAAMASRRIRLSARRPLEDVWEVVGACSRPARDHSRKFAIVAITLTAAAWIVLPLAVAVAVWS